MIFRRIPGFLLFIMTVFPFVYGMGFEPFFPLTVRADDTVTANVMASSIPNQAEVLTQQYLTRIEERLRIRLSDQNSSTADAWRMRLIRFSMWGPMADVSGWTLETLGDNKGARTALFFIMPMVRWMSETFLFPVETGGTAQERQKAIDKVLGLIESRRQQGFSVSLDNVGDAAASPEDAQAYKNYYLALINRFVETNAAGELNMSLKLSALTCDLAVALGEGDAARAKQEEIKASLSELLRAAVAAPNQKIFLRIDMEEYAYKNLTLRLFRETVEENGAIVGGTDGGLRLGVVIQAYLRDSACDVKALGEWARVHNLCVPIRLVKGAYLGYERALAREENRKSPVWNHKPSTDANYEALSAYMLLNLDIINPAFATHNIRSQAHVMALTDAYGLDKSTAVFQMLYGMGDPIKRVVVDMGFPMREYVPAGSLARGLKYAGRRFNELAKSDNALARTMRGDFQRRGRGRAAFHG